MNKRAESKSSQYERPRQIYKAHQKTVSKFGESLVDVEIKTIV